MGSYKKQLEERGRGDNEIRVHTRRPHRRNNDHQTPDGIVSISEFIDKHLAARKDEFYKKFNLVSRDHKTYNYHWSDYDIHFALSTLMPFAYCSKTLQFTLGYEIIYNEVSKRDDTLCERAILFEGELRKKLEQARLPLFTIDGGHRVKDFDIIGISIYYSLQYLNVVPFLKQAQIPVLSLDRDEKHPLIIAGGQACFNPEPIANFIDVFVIGEGEEVIHDILDIYKDFKPSDKASRQELLLRLAELEGIYVPMFYEVEYDDERWIKRRRVKHGVPETIRKRTVNDIGRSLLYASSISLSWHNSNRATIELARGCKFKCRFCQLGHTMKPYRENKLSDIIRCIDSFWAERTQLQLFSPITTHHSNIEEIMNHILSNGKRMMLGECRIDKMVDYAQRYKACGQNRVTLGLEGLTYRLRKLVGKNLPDAIVRDCINACYENKIMMKFCMIWGLPGTTKADVDEFLRFVIANVRPSGYYVDFNFTTFRAKPHTPMQWFGLNEQEDLRRYLDRELKKLRNAGIKVGWCGLRGTHDELEYVLTLGDRRLYKPLMETPEYIYTYGKINKRALAKFYELCEKYNVPYRSYVVEKNLGQTFPWDFIDVGTPKENLKRIYLEMIEQSKPEPVVIEQALTNGTMTFESPPFNVSHIHLKKVIC